MSTTGTITYYNLLEYSRKLHFCETGCTSNPEELECCNCLFIYFVFGVLVLEIIECSQQLYFEFSHSEKLHCNSHLHLIYICFFEKVHIHFVKLECNIDELIYSCNTLLLN